MSTPRCGAGSCLNGARSFRSGRLLGCPLYCPNPERPQRSLVILTGTTPGLHQRRALDADHASTEPGCSDRGDHPAHLLLPHPQRASTESGRCDRGDTPASGCRKTARGQPQRSSVVLTEETRSTGSSPAATTACLNGARPFPPGRRAGERPGSAWASSLNGARSLRSGRQLSTGDCCGGWTSRLNGTRSFRPRRVVLRGRPQAYAPLASTEPGLSQRDDSGYRATTWRAAASVNRARSFRRDDCSSLCPRS